MFGAGSDICRLSVGHASGAKMRDKTGMALKVNEAITIADWELSEQFVRASGPGGQNVNKVSSAVELRFEAARSPNLSAAVKARLRRIAGRRWTRDGAVVLQVDETRSQARNREIARARLAELLVRAAERPKRRLASKARRGVVKALRGKIGDEE